MLSAVSQPIPPVEVTGGYKLGVAAVALLMVLLTFGFFATIGLTVLALGAHLVYSLTHASAGGMACVMFDVVLLAAGCLFGLFLLKPLFAPPAKPQVRMSLAPHEHPLLYAFVERLCATVGAPTPARIDVDTEVNASASFGRGLWSVVGGGDLVLTIGLPLAAGLPLNQLTGILAHEFGHFRQGSAMRLGYLINRINSWFARVVFERDAWDVRLARLSQEAFPVSLFALLLMVTIYLTRRVLWLLVIALHAVSCYLSRQMEFDADLSEIYISGSRVFERTSMNLYALGVARDWAHDDLEASWRENRLSDNLPALVMTNVERLQKKPKTAAKIKNAVLELKTEFLDTHPATSERIERARRQNALGTFQLSPPAHVLFNNFEALCQKATLAYYRQALGDDKVSQRNLVANTHIAAEQNETEEALKALRRYFQGRVVGWRQIFLPVFDFSPPPDPQRAVEILRQTRKKIVEDTDQVAQVVWQYEKAEDRLKDLAVAQMAHDVGMQFNPYEFGMTDNSPWTLHQTREQAHRDLQAAQGGLNQLLRTAQARMIAALRLLQIPEVAARVEDADKLNQRCRRMAATLAALEIAWPSLLQLRDRAVELGILLNNFEGNEQNHLMSNRIRQTAQLVVQCMHTSLHQLVNFPYPFAHADGRISIAIYVRKELPDPNNIEDVFSATGETLDKLMSLYYRALAHLAVTAEKVERAFNLPMLPEVVDPLSDED